MREARTGIVHAQRPSESAEPKLGSGLNSLGGCQLSEMASFPRILLLSASVFNPYSGGGITLTNLFRGWPRDSIAMIHQDSIGPDTSICDNYYRLTAEEVGFFWPLRLFQRSRSESGLRDTQADDRQDPGAASKRDSLRFLGKRAVLATLRGLDESRMLAENARISSRLADWIGRFRPQLLYTLLGDLTYLRLTRLLVARFSLPVAVHIMDDWLSTRYSTGLVAPWLRRRMTREFLAVNRDARLRMAICQEMSEAYQHRYGKRFLPFHNALELDQWVKHGKKAWDCAKPFKLMYSGSIENVQIDALRDIARVVLELNQAGVDIEFDIYTAWFYAERFGTKLSNPPVVSIRDVPESTEDMARALSAADALVMAYNFDPDATTYFRYSMPTKVPAYMISGTPVLAYGPGETAAMRYARTEGWGCQIDTRDDRRLKEALTNLMFDRQLRERLGRRAQALAFENHDAQKVRRNFQMALVGAVQG